ncbi:hypothetical protein ACVW2L_003060 [Mucilaginibacter sp. HD30]
MKASRFLSGGFVFFSDLFEGLNAIGKLPARIMIYSNNYLLFISPTKCNTVFVIDSKSILVALVCIVLKKVYTFND